MSNRMSKVTAKPSVAAGLPARPEAVRGGELARLWRRLDQDQDADGMAGGAVNLLNRQLEAYSATVRTATPESDMAEVAAAEAGIRVVERALGYARDTLRAAALQHQATRQRFEAAWGRYQRLIRYLDGEDRDPEFQIRQAGGLSMTLAAAVTELRELLGADALPPDW